MSNSLFCSDINPGKPCAKATCPDMKFKLSIRHESCSLSTYLGYVMKCGQKLRGFTPLTWILFLTVCQLAAQPNRILFREFTDMQGLPNNQFRFTIQDRSGRLWMGGNDGLARYDGYQFVTFRHSNADTTSISGNNISELYEDSKGRLWVGIFGSGINISNTAKTAFHQISISGRDTVDATALLISDIVEDGKGRMWVSSSTGLLVLEEQEVNAFKSSDLLTRLLDDSCAEIKPRCLFSDSVGNVWIGSDTGLYHFDVTSNAITCPSGFPDIPPTPVQMIGRDRQGRIWISRSGSGARLYYANPGEVSFTGFPCIPFTSQVRGLQFAFDLDNRIWISEFGAQFYAYDFRDSTLFLESSVNSSVPFERFVRNPFVDHSGNVWLHGAGYLIYPYPKGFRNYLHPFTFHQSNTVVFVSDDFMWVGYREQGVVRQNMVTGEVTHFSSTNRDAWIPVDHVQAITRLMSGNILLAGFNQLILVGAGDKVIKTFEAGGTNRSIMQDSRGRIWVGGFGGLLLLSESEGVLDTIVLPKNIGDERQFIQKIVEDQDGQIWFASDLNGLAKFDPETGHITQFLPVKGDLSSLPSSSVDDLILGQDGFLWAATDVALVRIDPKSHDMKVFDKSHGFESDYISTLVCDPEGKIWASTYAGISRFNPETFEVENFNVDDGLLNRSYYSRSGYCDSDGTMYFGGNNGVDFFHPRDLRLNPAPPLVSLEGITIDNTHWVSSTEIDIAEGLQLTYQNDFIEILFTGLYYSSPEDLKYFYKMDGLGDAWIAIESKSSVIFPDLKPGDYTFRVKALSPDNVWSAQELKLPLSVAPPVYQTLWFRILMVCVLAGILVGVIRYREKRIATRQAEEAEITRKITELEKRALQAQMNPHFIYNCMNSIQQFMVVHDFEGAMKYLTRFSRILRAVLNMSASSRVSLSDELKLIEDYLELENMRFPDKFSYQISVSPDLNVHTVEIPPFFIQPQVENAIRHGLLKKGSHGHLFIHIGKDNNYVKVTVEDNGIGRQASGSARRNEAVARESKGLAIVEERLSHLHQSNGMHPFRITDLYDGENQPAGTRVEVFLPLDT